MDVNARWVTIDGKQLLSITLPGHQHVQIDRVTGWRLLLFLRAAMHAKPPNPGDNERHGT